MSGKCKWQRKKGSGDTGAVVECLKKFIYANNFVDDFVYCPFCSKKIERINKEAEPWKNVFSRMQKDYLSDPIG